MTKLSTLKVAKKASLSKIIKTNLKIKKRLKLNSYKLFRKLIKRQNNYNKTKIKNQIKITKKNLKNKS